MPCVISRPAAVLLADLVAFTSLTDQMALEGLAGGERLAGIVRDFVRRIAAIAEDRGGELTTFAGDAAMFVWFVDDETELADAVFAAADAGLAIQKALVEGRDPARLAARCSIGAGPLHHFEIGGRADEWHAVLAGPALDEATAAASRVKPGELGLAVAAWRLVQDRCHRWDERSNAIIVDQVVGLPRLPRHFTPTVRAIPPAVLRASIAPMVLERLEGHQRSWLGEFRTVTVAFTVLRHPEHARPADALAKLHEAAQLVQKVLARFEGHIHQIRADQDGITVIAVFGLPPFAHEDDATRGTNAALALHQEWSHLGVTTSTGIATGRVFATTLGETGIFTLVGPTMNLAARLMQLNTGVVCDGETVRAGRQHRRIAARELAARTVKGKDEPIVAFAPYMIGADERAAKRDPVFAGRTAEIAELRAAIRQLSEGHGGTIVVEGEAGIGKSALLGRIRATATDAGLAVLAGYGDDTEKRSPYFAWRPVFQVLFGTAALAAAERSRQVVAGLGEDGHLAPLLSDVLELSLSDSSETLQLAGEARAAGTRKLLLDRLAAAAIAAPGVIILEDIHWLDTSSFALLVAAAEAGLPFLFVCATRPNPPDEASYERLLQAPGLRHLRLHGLSADETGAVLASTLGAATTAAEVSDFVLSRTGGNPLFIGEIVPLMRDRGLLLVERGEVEIAGPAALAKDDLDRALASRGVSSTLEGIVLARFDRLPPRHKATLQAAAVVGQSFGLADVRGLLAQGASLEDDLATLAAEGFLAPRSDSPTAEFRHAVIRDVVYGALSFAERRALHYRIAEALAQTPAAAAGSIDALLGHHFGAAAQNEKAIPHLVRAAQDALKIFANVEAIALGERALGMMGELGKGAGKVDEAWRSSRRTVEFLLGRACLALSRYPESKQHSDAGLRLFGSRFPSALPNTVLRLLLEVGRQMRYRRFGAHHANAAAAEDLRSAAIALEGMAEIYFYEGDGLKCLYASLRMLNLAELVGPSPELARAYAALSGIAGLIGMRGVAASYRRRSLDMLDSTGDRAAAAWALNLLGVSRLGTGDWEEALAFFNRTAAIAGPLGERRRMRDGVENAAIVAGCRGDWQTALAGVEEMRVSADRDRDQRYLLLAYREQGYLNAQLGRWQAAEEALGNIRSELARGIKAEELPTRQDLHAVAATLALERGDDVAAAFEANAALVAASHLSGSGSFPNRYWTLFLVGRVWLSLAQGVPKSARATQVDGAYAAYRLLKRMAGAHPIAVPAALLVRGGVELVRGRDRRAQRCWQRAHAAASALGMRYETALAQQALEGASGPVRSTVDGLRLFARSSEIPAPAA